MSEKKTVLLIAWSLFLTSIVYIQSVIEWDFKSNPDAAPEERLYTCHQNESRQGEKLLNTTID